MATLQLAREGYGMELRHRGTFQALLAGGDVGSIEPTQTIEVPLGRPVTPCKSGHGAALWPLHVASIVKQDLAIAPRRA